MPVLPAEPDRFPECLFEDSDLPVQGERAWWVLHTRPRQEKSLARQLHHGRIPFYLPLFARRRRLRGSITTSYFPLFASYLFLLADRDERIAALSTARVVQPLRVVAQEELWRDLAQIHRLIASGATVTPEDRLVPGALVEIKSGPLAGLKGRIISAASGRRFVVQVDFIQRGASVLLDDFTLARIDEKQ
jgi:transcriptional antiterminator RfaH